MALSTCVGHGVSQFVLERILSASSSVTRKANYLSIHPIPPVLDLEKKKDFVESCQAIEPCVM